MIIPTVAIGLLVARDAVQPSNTSTPVVSDRATALKLAGRSSLLPVSADARCGEGHTCLGSKYGDSCSQYGWCGFDSPYSGAGCQPDYGTCEGSPSSNDARSPVLSSDAASTTTLTLYTTVTPRPASSDSAAISSTTFSYFPGASTSSGATPSGTSGSSSETYIKVFTGDGSPASGWPLIDKWLDFETLWSTNLEAVIAKSCEQFNVPNNTPEESEQLKSAIQSIATSHDVDPRFALGIALQESNGCVRAPTTEGSVANPGIFQSYMGSGSCNRDGSVASPCPDSEIRQMVKDGVTGTVAGSMSIMDAVKKAGGSGAEQYYRAARIYNSGSIAPSGLLQDGVATHCYATDIANRLLGWDKGPTGCTLNG